MTSPLSGRPEPEAPESAVDARRRLADAQASSASQAAASAAALAQAQHDVAVSLRHAGPLAVGTINGAEPAPADVEREVLTFTDVVARDHWDDQRGRNLIGQMHYHAITAECDRLGVAPQWTTLHGPWATTQLWATVGTSDDGRPMTGTSEQPPEGTEPNDDHTHYLVTTTVTVVRL